MSALPSSRSLTPLASNRSLFFRLSCRCRSVRPSGSMASELAGLPASIDVRIALGRRSIRPLFAASTTAPKKIARRARRLRRRGPSAHRQPPSVARAVRAVRAAPGRARRALVGDAGDPAVVRLARRSSRRGARPRRHAALASAKARYGGGCAGNDRHYLQDLGGLQSLTAVSACLPRSGYGRLPINGFL